MLTVGSLFSGIEGFGLGFERAGARVVWHVEKDEACQGVIRHWFQLADGRRHEAGDHGGGGDGASLVAGSSPVLHADVRTVGTHNLSAVDLVCGGFPCQDLSVAGRRAGLAGERSGLWYEFHRILSELRPRWVVIENVPGLLSSESGRDFAVVLGGLAKLGYGWAYRVLDAQFFGVAQRRRRVFIVGCLGDTAAAVQVLFESESCDGDSPPRRQAREDLAGTLGGGSGERGWPQDTERMTFLPEATSALTSNGGFDSDGSERGDKIIVSPALRSNPYGDHHGDEARLVTHTLSSEGADAGEDGTGRGTPLLVVGGGSYPTVGLESPSLTGRRGDQTAVVTSAVRRLTPVECERLQGFPDDWTAGLSDSARYRMLGNAVCVPVAEWIGRQLIAVLDRTAEVSA